MKNLKIQPIYLFINDKMPKFDFFFIKPSTAMLECFIKKLF